MLVLGGSACTFLVKNTTKQKRFTNSCFFVVFPRHQWVNSHLKCYMISWSPATHFWGVRSTFKGKILSYCSHQISNHLSIISRLNNFLSEEKFLWHFPCGLKLQWTYFLKCPRPAEKIVFHKLTIISYRMYDADKARWDIFLLLPCFLGASLYTVMWN